MSTDPARDTRFDPVAPARVPGDDQPQAGVASATPASWPVLPWRDWEPTLSTLHMWVQIVGKVRLALASPLNHWWHVPLYVTARGLTTSPIPYGDREFQVEFDFVDHQLRVTDGDPGAFSMALESRSVARFYRDFLAGLRSRGIDVAISPHPVEVADPVPFDQDEGHAAVSIDLTLATPVDSTDHTRGGGRQLVVYGDFECPYTAAAMRSIGVLLASGPAFELVFRHFRLRDIHPHAQGAAAASEGAARQGRFWEMHDLLFGNQRHLEPADLRSHAERLGLDLVRFQSDLVDPAVRARIERDVESGERSGVDGTPSLSIDGMRYRGPRDPASLAAALN